jgi:hypothetical protein
MIARDHSSIPDPEPINTLIGKGLVRESVDGTRVAYCRGKAALANVNQRACHPTISAEDRAAEMGRPETGQIVLANVSSVARNLRRHASIPLRKCIARFEQWDFH